MKAPEVKTALVTGGGSGMGRAAALALAGLGVEVVAADLNLDGALETISMIEGAGGRGRAARLDAADSGSVGALFDSIAQDPGHLELLVHSAGILGRTAFLEDVTDEEWRRMIEVNLGGTFFCARAAVRLMKNGGGGRIILFSSVASLTPTPGAVPYSAAKGGVNMLTRSLAAEAAKHNIRVNAVAPGYVETPMLQGLPEGFEGYVIRKTPLGRLGRPEEVGGLVAFLASDEADYFTGQIFSPNGGFVI